VPRHWGLFNGAEHTWSGNGKPDSIPAFGLISFPCPKRLIAAALWVNPGKKSSYFLSSYLASTIFRTQEKNAVIPQEKWSYTPP
jgi:hypothetical protein